MRSDSTTDRPAEQSSGETPPPDSATRAGRRRAELVKWAAPLIGLVAIVVIAAITTPQVFNSSGIRLILIQVGLIGVAAIGQTVVLLVAGIDLSVGSVIGLTMVTVAVVSNGSDGDLGLAILAATGAGLAVGLCNGLLVSYRRVPPFVATFASFVVIQGIITAWTNGAPAGSIPAALKPLGSHAFLGVPVPVWIFAVLALVAGFALGRTTFGRSIYATGANEPAARASAINTRLVVLSAYVVCALLAVLAGLIMAGYIGRVDATLTRGLNLDSIAAAVVGGIALTGGRGRILQTVVGVLILAVLLAWMVQLGAGIGGQLLVEGVAILLAVILQSPTIQGRLRHEGN